MKGDDALCSEIFMFSRGLHPSSTWSRARCGLQLSWLWWLWGTHTKDLTLFLAGPTTDVGYRSGWMGPINTEVSGSDTSLVERTQPLHGSQGMQSPDQFACWSLFTNTIKQRRQKQHWHNQLWLSKKMSSLASTPTRTSILQWHLPANGGRLAQCRIPTKQQGCSVLRSWALEHGEKPLFELYLTYRNDCFQWAREVSGMCYKWLWSSTIRSLSLLRYRNQFRGSHFGLCLIKVIARSARAMLAAIGLISLFYLKYWMCNIFLTWMLRRLSFKSIITWWLCRKMLSTTRYSKSCCKY